MDYNIYCDESCHLANDKCDLMVLGGIWCPSGLNKKASQDLRQIKRDHRLSQSFETKWTKVSQGRIDYYLALMDYFFNQHDLHFRCLVANGKTRLKHDAFEQSHDEWYYKMYFDMIKAILAPHDRYRIYLDLKDTRGSGKVRKLREVLCNNMLDFERKILRDIQLVRSHEVELVQMADLLIGCVAYVNRGLSGSAAKNQVARHLQDLSEYKLTKSTLLSERKFNLFMWHPTEPNK